MIQDIVFAIWFLLPAAAANVAPIFAAAIPALEKYDAPIDGGKTFAGSRLLGSHKTWRGIISGVILSTIVLAIEQFLYVHFEWARYAAHPVQYAMLPTFLFGPALAIGALGGDALKSFFKRRIGIGSGRTWLFFDQVDYIIGAIIISLPFAIVNYMNYIWMLVVWFIVHVISSYSGWLLKLKSDPI